MNQEKHCLITTIGTGMFKEGGYRETTYVFPDGTEFKTAVFLEALLHAKSFKFFGRVLIVGTSGSDWGVLTTLLPDNQDELRLSLMMASENRSISNDLLEPLMILLKNHFGIEFSFVLHEPKVDADTISDIMFRYIDAAAQIPADVPVLLDITHGFRSMPVLLFQSLQYSNTDGRMRRIGLVYGEYIDSQKKSRVRDLSKYWFFSEYTTALHLFREKYDGFLLASLLHEEWPDLAKWFLRFSEAVQANFCLHLPEIFRNLHNVLDNRKGAVEWWLRDITDDISSLAALSHKKHSDILFAFSGLLAQKGMFSQAIISLQIAVECKSIELAGDAPDKYGDYDYWHNTGKDTQRKVIHLLSYESKREIKHLNNLRNQTAHGGAKGDNGSFPDATYLKKTYPNLRKAVLEVMLLDGL